PDPVDFARRMPRFARRATRHEHCSWARRMNTVEHSQATASPAAAQPATPSAKAAVRATTGKPGRLGPWIASLVLLLGLGGVGFALWAIKEQSELEAREVAAHQPEPMETVRVATAEAREYRR